MTIFQQSTSIPHIESDIPSLHAPRVNTVQCIKKLEKVEERLSEFYNGDKNLSKKHDWDKTRIKQADYTPLPTPAPQESSLGRFKSTGRLTSLHSSFLSRCFSTTNVDTGSNSASMDTTSSSSALPEVAKDCLLYTDGVGLDEET
ncbi:hypothetical protein EC957_008745 [Mortierella hygrophila]|uniref:Uncharacterized protein n=1 Tax=Mortierella hygrophila TaxID=979708 RepID=A0A9P6FCV2_9FUNG|nr:hypothetical protein EC957_008745 [Mortierella hygrophila]